MKKNKKKLQFLFWIKYISYGSTHKRWLIFDCPADVTDLDEADAYLERNMGDLMAEYDWSLVLNYKPTEIGYNLKTPSEKLAAKKQESIERVFEKGLQTSEVKYDSNTAMLDITPKGLEKHQLNLIKLAEILIGENKSPRGRYEVNPNEIMVLKSDFGEVILEILDVEVYRNAGADTVIYENEFQALRDASREQQLKFRVMHAPETVTDEMLEETFAKGHINYYRPDHIGIVYNGFSLSFNASAFTKQYLKDAKQIDSRIIKLLNPKS